MVVLDAVHQIQAEQANDLAVRWNCKAGKCGSCSAEVNGHPRLMCMTRLNELDLSTAGHGRADARVPADPGPGDRRLVELPGQEEHPEVQAAAARRRRRHVADAAGGRRARAGIPQVHRVLPLPGRLPRAARPPAVRRVHRPAASWSTPPRSRCTRSTSRTACADLQEQARASATATSRSAAPRSARKASRSPTTRSSRSRSASSIGSTIRSRRCSGCLRGRSRPCLS